MSADARCDLSAALEQARMMRPRLIGFCGSAGAGKTYAAELLARDWGYSRVRFAGPLKVMLHALGLTEAETDGAAKDQPSAMLGGRTPRYAMQTLGTEWGRDLISPDLWLHAWERAAARYLDQGLPVVVDDVRFVNEAAAIMRLGGALVRIERPGANGIGGGHASERQGVLCDTQITNTGDASFARAVDALVKMD